MTLHQARQNMQNTIALLETQLTGIGTRTNVKLVSSVRVTDLTGNQLPLEQCAVLQQKGSAISVVPYDPATIHAVRNVLVKNGFDAYVFSKREVVVNVAAPSGEETQKVHARVRKLGEEAKVAIRNIRKKCKNGFSSNDKSQQSQFDRELESITSTSIKRVDDIVRLRTEEQ